MPNQAILAILLVSTMPLSCMANFESVAQKYFNGNNGIAFESNDNFTPVVGNLLSLSDFEWELLNNSNSILHQQGLPEVSQIGHQLRLFRKLHDHFYAKRQDPQEITLSSLPDTNYQVFADQFRMDNNAYVDKAANIYSQFESSLFDWIKPGFTSTIQMRDSFKGNGIVISVGNKYMEVALSTIRMIREVLNCTLPIEVFFSGEDDLSPANREILNSISGVRTLNIFDIFDKAQTDAVKFASKPFAMLASSFQNALLIDADTVLLQSPEVFFESNIFKETGTLFYTDRSMFQMSPSAIGLIDSLLNNNRSNYSRGFRIFNNLSGHQQESGVVLIDKRAKFLGLLANCYMSLSKFRPIFDAHFYGDKELFWLGFETAGLEYRFDSHLPGVIGYFEMQHSNLYCSICSRQMLHLDESGTPLWFNGGLSTSKFQQNAAELNLNGWAAEPGEWSMGIDWGSGNGCLRNNSPCRVLSSELLAILQGGRKCLQDARRAIGAASNKSQIE